MLQALQDLNKLKQYEDGWGGAHTVAPNEVSLSKAQKIISAIYQEGFCKPALIVGYEHGGVTFAFMNAEVHVELYVLNTGALKYLYESKSGSMSQGNFSSEILPSLRSINAMLLEV